MAMEYLDGRRRGVYWRLRKRENGMGAELTCTVRSATIVLDCGLRGLGGYCNVRVQDQLEGGWG